MQIVVVVSQFPTWGDLADDTPAQMLRKIMMQVMSSIEVSSSCHRLMDSLMIASAAFSAELAK